MPQISESHQAAFDGTQKKGNEMLVGCNVLLIFSLSVFLGASPGHCGSGILLSTSFHRLGVNPVGMDFADLDGDSFVDAVVANRISSDVTVLFGKSQPPYFEEPVFIPTGALPMQVFLRDVTSDGVPEILTLNTGDGSVTVHDVSVSRAVTLLQTVLVGPDPSRFVLIDLEGASRLDLAVLSQSAGTLRLFRGNGDGSFGTGVTHAVGSIPTKAEFADFDGDGILDVAVTLQLSQFLNVFRGLGDLQIDSPVSYPVPGGSLELLARDLSGNGIIDLAVMSRGRGKVTVLRGLGTGAFVVLPTVLAGDTLRDMLVTDVTLDGLPDIIVAASNSDTVVILPGTGNGNLGAPLSLPTGDYPFEVAVADLSGDEIPDLICANLFSNDVTIYEGRGGLNFEPVPTTLAVGRRPVLMVSHDLNQDGPPELIIAHYASDNLGLLINERRLREVMAGNINSGAGEVMDVLFANGQVGDAIREFHLPLDQPFEIRMEAPPAGPASAPFVLYALASAPGVNGVTPQPGGVGDFAFSTPLTGGGTRLIVLANNLGHRPLLGHPSIDRPILPAPSVVVRRNQGFSRSAIVTLQAFVSDFGSASVQPISVSNAIAVFIGQ